MTFQFVCSYSDLCRFIVTKMDLEPHLSPPPRYHLMRLCWSLEPTHRPTFKTIGQLISRLLPSTNEMLPHHSDQVNKNRFSAPNCIWLAAALLWLSSSLLRWRTKTLMRAKKKKMRRSEMNRSKEAKNEVRVDQCLWTSVFEMFHSSGFLWQKRRFSYI